MTPLEKWIKRLPPRLGPRIERAIAGWNITTLDELAEAHKNGNTAQWRGIGEKALAEIDKRVNRRRRIKGEPETQQPDAEPEPEPKPKPKKRLIERRRVSAAMLHEQIEDVAQRAAERALETGRGPDVTMARRWYLLANDVREATERRLMKSMML